MKGRFKNQEDCGSSPGSAASGVRELRRAMELVLSPGWPWSLLGGLFPHVKSKPRRSLTYIREHPDAALHRGLLARREPVAVVNPEHTLKQLHEDGLASLQEQGQRGGRVKTFICERPRHWSAADTALHHRFTDPQARVGGGGRWWMGFQKRPRPTETKS